MKQLFIENVFTGILIIIVGMIIDFKQLFNDVAIQNYIPAILICVVLIVIVCTLLYNRFNSKKQYDKDLLIYATYMLFVNLFKISPILVVAIQYFKEYTGQYICLTPSLVFYFVGGILLGRFLYYIILKK